MESLWNKTFSSIMFLSAMVTLALDLLALRSLNLFIKYEIVNMSLQVLYQKQIISGSPLPSTFCNTLSGVFESFGMQVASMSKSFPHFCFERQMRAKHFGDQYIGCGISNAICLSGTQLRLF